MGNRFPHPEWQADGHAVDTSHPASIAPCKENMFLGLSVAILRPVTALQDRLLPPAQH